MMRLRALATLLALGAGLAISSVPASTPAMAQGAQAVLANSQHFDSLALMEQRHSLLVNGPQQYAPRNGVLQEGQL